MNTTTIVAIVALVVVALGGWFYFSSTNTESEPVFCTADAMQCPDGTYVGRTGPNCEFVCPEPGAGGGAGGGILPYNSGIRGVVMVGPTCPVERNPPDPACADKPGQLYVNVFRGGAAGERIAIVESGTDGTFEFSLPPGDYIVGTGEMGPPTCPRTNVVVEPNGYTNITLLCDSGIR